MAVRLAEGAVLLVGGYEPARQAAPEAVPMLGEIGEVLLSSAPALRIRRLSPAFGERYAPHRASLKHHVDDLAQQRVRVAMLVIAAAVTVEGGALALITERQYREYPEDATLPLAWIRDRMRAAVAESVLVLIAARGDGVDAAAHLDEVATGRPNHVVALDVASAGLRGLEVFLAGLRGEALDTATGTITLRSISAHLARTLPGAALQRSSEERTLASSPPLAGLWDARRSLRSRTTVGAAATADGDDLQGVVLPGRFRLDSVLARGTFGVIYRARQLAVERDVAVKVLQAGIDPSSEDGRLFVQEIQGVGRIDHGNVVRIHQADITPDGRLFFAMELLVGRDLQQIIEQEGRLEPGRAIALIRQLLAGLGAAHEAGLVHADVKPANVFVVENGERERVVLLDFGLSRLRAAGRAAESAGGTPAYMAPEQLRDARVDARSDLFAAALVLVTLLTGWRRRSVMEIVPPLDEIGDPALRAALARAFAIDPADRYQTAAELADALSGDTPMPARALEARPPFRHLASFTERDGGHLYGRDRDIAALIEHALYRRAVVYAAPSGTGKTSLLRAGLLPRLEKGGVAAVYVACRSGDAGTLAGAIWSGATCVVEAMVARHEHRGGRFVLIVDQVEAHLSDPRQVPAELGELLAPERWPAELDVCVILSIREDFLARLIGASRLLDEGTPIVRLGPLGPEAAREAIVGPLVENRLAIEPALLEVLLDDLQAATRAIGAEMGWGEVPAVYPPHLQLACSVLYDALGPDEATLTLAHYRRLGGLAAIVGEHLDRVLDTELDAAAAAIARDLFLALVTAVHTKASRTEAELLEIVGSAHGASPTLAVLEALRVRGLLVRARARGDEPIWELVHDSLVPRVMAWIDRRDLARRRAAEVVRYHVRRSRADAPSLLDRDDLRELREHPEVIAELEREWAQRTGEPWTPARLVARSRSVLRRRHAMFAGVAVVATAALSGAWYARAAEQAARAREQALRDRDVGRFTLRLEPFDWDEAAQRAIPVRIDRVPALAWTLRPPDPADPDAPGEAPLASLTRGPSTAAPDRGARLDHAEARGGPAFLVVDGRGTDGETCPPSIVPLRQLPGYASRVRAEPVLRVHVPTCHASRAGMVHLAAGPFVRGGAGQPPSPFPVEGEPVEGTIVDMPELWIDRTEVTNAAFANFAEFGDLTGVALPPYPETVELKHAGEPLRPVAGVKWRDARAYCQFMGKVLPTADQWQRALRGRLILDDGLPNPMPDRNFPWGEPLLPAPANLDDDDDGDDSSANVGSFPRDRSPDGVLDLAGNVQEWTASSLPSANGRESKMRVTRGGNWSETTSEGLVEFMAIKNPRPEDFSQFLLGFRCAVRTVGDAKLAVADQ